jgi:hypothetical protein
MKNKFILFLTAGVLALSLTSCFENPTWTYDLAPVVEFKNPRAGFATQPTNNVSNGVAQRTIRQLLKRDSILVQLVGAQRPDATSIGYIIDASKSTAVENINYRIAETKGTITIPANSSSAYIKFEILEGIPATVAATQNYPLVLTLVGNDQIKPSENYKTFTVNIRR